MPRVISSDEHSIYSVSDSGPESSSRSKVKGVKRKVAPVNASKKRKPIKIDQGDIEDLGQCITRPHGAEYHGTDLVAGLQEDLPSWFEGVREKRGMPWRKRYDDSLSMDQKGQRAYEVVSEVMLQQTQVATVIAYWKKWIEKWPTISDLAKADVEEVNAAWRGLGYYRRARSLLAGAKTVMEDPKYKGRLPDNPAVLEKEIEGVGRYTAGAISSMAYGIRTPIVDGNVHRLFTRLLAVHAPQTAPATIKFLWQAAQSLVDSLIDEEGREGVAGDWNQALMELGSQICKPVSPDCKACPLQSGCKAYAELTKPPSSSYSEPCTLCAPIPATRDTAGIPSVTVFPMKKEKKVSREEEAVVCVTEWRSEGKSWWLFVKRPEKGLLAGLFEPPTTPLTSDPSPNRVEEKELALTTLSSIITPVEDLASMITTHRHIASIPHIFSHINMKYHIQHLVLDSTNGPPACKNDRAVWLDEGDVESANVGTGVKKVWAEIYGSWGNFETAKSGPTASKAKKPKKAAVITTEGKVIKKIMMPAMPQRGIAG